MSRTTEFAVDERSNALSLLLDRAPETETVPEISTGQKKKQKGNAKQKKEYAAEAKLELKELIGSTNSRKGEKKKYYLTTAINYANGSPHMGHAYEAILTDMFARYRRIAGFETFFLTGADEHGQKIANTASKLGKTPKELVDECVGKFKALDELLDVCYDDYLRTTSERHKEACHTVWTRCAKDITLEEYEGWYDERAELFVKQSDAEMQDFKDADGIPLKRTKEACYFFALGKYVPEIRKFIQERPDFVQPASRRTEILKMLDDAEAVEKLAISRTTFDWGVPLPPGFDKGHVMYVWIDALTNYLTGVGFPNEEEGDFLKFWPCDCHVIGKDIVRFHAIYWPAFLLSAGIPLPKHVFCHGFVLDAAGAKMSKTLGNVVDPVALVEKYGSDTFRFYSLKDASPGADVKFSETALVLSRNAELADCFGNLVHRAAAMAELKTDSKVPPASSKETLAKPFDLGLLVSSAAAAADKFDAGGYAEACLVAARDANKWVQDSAPWSKPPEEAEPIVRDLLEACFALSLFFAPFIPRAATYAAKRVGGDTLLKAGVTFPDLLKTPFRVLPDLAPVTPGPPLFAQILMDGSAEDALKKEKSKGKNDANKKKNQPEPFVEYASSEDTAASRLAMVVGKIIDVWEHPDSEKLFCEKIDCGEAFGGVREIGSGLRKHYTVADLRDRKVLIAANLKTKKLAGFPSQGMVLCATDSDGKTVCVEPPTDSELGDRVDLPDLPNPSATDKVCDKQKLFLTAQPHFVVKAGICYYKDKPFHVRGAPCTAPSPDGATIC